MFTTLSTPISSSTSDEVAPRVQQGTKLIIVEHLGDAADCMVEAMETLRELCKKDASLAPALRTLIGKTDELRRELTSLKAKRHVIAYTEFESPNPAIQSFFQGKH